MDNDKQPTARDLPPAVLYATSYGFLGALIGTLLAFSAQSLAQAAMAAVFSFFGGTALQAAMTKGRALQTMVAGATLALSVGALFGIYSGIYVNEHRLLSPTQMPPTASAAASTSEPTKYLRSEVISAATAIDAKLRTKAITTEEAYAQLQKLLEK